MQLLVTFLVALFVLLTIGGFFIAVLVLPSAEAGVHRLHSFSLYSTICPLMCLLPPDLPEFGNTNFGNVKYAEEQKQFALQRQFAEHSEEKERRATAREHERRKMHESAKEQYNGALKRLTSIEKLRAKGPIDDSQGVRSAASESEKDGCTCEIYLDQVTLLCLRAV